LRLSYWLDGTAATFSTWAGIVTKYETARRTAIRLDDEGPLQDTVQVDQGGAYTPMALRKKRNLSLADLKAQARNIEQGVAPKWTRFILITADVQKGRFVCQATAFGEGAERQIIDRFDLVNPPPTAPRAEGRALAPELYIEDWDVLLPLLDKVYPLEGEDYGLRPMALGCDFHGEPGVSDRATEFWQARRAANEVQRWYMIRGHGGFKVADRASYRSPARAANGAEARDIILLNLATDRLKDSVYASTQRPDGGPGAMHVGAWMTDAHLTELTAEIRTGKGYEKRKGMVRNETVDLSVYALGLAEYKGLNRFDVKRPPAWARLGPSNENAVKLEADGSAPAKVMRKPVAAPPRPTSMF
jgi:phage terminase large subunit GpA-like protein